MNNFIIETSARHVHVTRETLEILFGKDFELEVKKPLSQPGQYASNQKVEVVGPKSSLKCSILGPVRPENQVELSFTDARAVGIVAPIRESGDVAGSAPCKIVGPCGEVELKEGVIIARRHIHMTPEETARAGADVKAKAVLPLHAGRFALSSHTWDDPYLRLEKASQAYAYQLLTPRMGEIVWLDGRPQSFSRWYADDAAREAEYLKEEP